MSELWDCYDSNFNILNGKVLVRGEESSFSDDEYHLVCEVAVKHRDGTYLLMKRDLHKETYPGYWEFSAGGSALQGESPLQCAKRELFEETGLNADTLLEVGRETEIKGHCHFVVYFATVSCEKNSVILQAGETIAYQWVTKSDIFSKRAQIANRRIFEMLPELDAVESH